MRSMHILLAVLVLALLVPSCASTDMAFESAGTWALSGQVISVHERVERVHGNPAEGAVAGAIIGGALGSALGGRGFGTLLGATSGAAIGADASQGNYLVHIFYVEVGFEDGAVRTFVYRNQLPFRAGDRVLWTPEGLFHDY